MSDKITSAANGRNLDALVRSLIEAACDTLAHDVDILEGDNDSDIANKLSLEKDFRKVLRYYRITNSKLNNTPERAGGADDEQ